MSHCCTFCGARLHDSFRAPHASKLLQTFGIHYSICYYRHVPVPCSCIFPLRLRFFWKATSAAGSLLQGRTLSSGCATATGYLGCLRTKFSDMFSFHHDCPKMVSMDMIHAFLDLGWVETDILVDPVFAAWELDHGSTVASDISCWEVTNMADIVHFAAIFVW